MRSRVGRLPNAERFRGFPPRGQAYGSSSPSPSRSFGQRLSLIEPVPSHPVAFGARCETTRTLTPATTVFRVTTFVFPGVVTVVEGPGTVTVWLGPVVVTDTVVGTVTVTVVVAPPVVVVVPVVVFAVVDQATPPVAESVSKAAAPTPPRTRATAIVSARIFLNSALPVSGPIGRIAPSCRRACLDKFSPDLRFRKRPIGGEIGWPRARATGFALDRMPPSRRAMGTTAAVGSPQHLPQLRLERFALWVPETQLPLADRQRAAPLAQEADLP